MAQGTTINSTGTTLSGGEGSGTHSAILSALNAIRYLKLLKAINDNKYKNREQPEAQSSQVEDDEPIDVDFEENQQNLLEPAKQSALPEPRKQLVAGKIDRDDDLVVEVKVGDRFIKDRYSNIENGLQNNLKPDEKRALGIAMLGGLPDRDVSITTVNEADEAVRFDATSQKNSGWSVDTNASTLNVSAQEVDEQTQTQTDVATNNIRSVMKETFEGNGPHIVSGPRFTIMMDHNTVLVVENDSNRVLDSVELDTVSGDVLKASQEVNGLNRADQAREALADYQPLGGAAISSTPIPRRKQKELTP